MEGTLDADRKLQPWERGAILLVALALAVLAFVLVLSPGIAIQTESGQQTAPDGRTLSEMTTSAPREHTEVTLLLGAASAFLFFWGLNGLRMASLTVGPVSGEVVPAEVKAAEAYATTDQAPIDVAVESALAPPEESEPAGEPRGAVLISDEAEAVYPLAAVPTSVVTDLLANWPGELPKPANLSTFEFASRRTGRGNHPWIIKFRDTPALRVSYGGQAKTDATVVEANA